MHAPTSFAKLDPVKRALVISAALHVIGGAALLAIEIDDGVVIERSHATVAIELIAPPAPATPGVTGGSTERSTASAPSTERARARRTTRVRSSERTSPAIEQPRWQPGDASGGTRDGDGDSEGDGAGAGGGRGAGIGFGDGGRIEPAPQTFALPAAPRADVRPPSKARPAKLVYPSRRRDLGAEALFVARVTVDTDGYVVGARLVKGRNGPADDEAADLIFRFRYLPALDDAGRAIRSTFDQPFHVGR